MKKYLIVFIVLFMFILLSCNREDEQFHKSVSKEDTITYSFKGNSNSDRLEKFLENIDKKKKDKIVIVRYTTEGDPTYTQFYFDGKNIKIAIDVSEDKFGGQDKDEIIYDTIKGGNELKDNLTKYLSDNGF